MGRHTAPMDLPDFWDEDPEIDRKEVRTDRNRAFGAVGLCLVLTVLAGFVGWLFGGGPAPVDASVTPDRVYVRTTATVTDTVTRHRTRFQTRTTTATPDPVTQTSLIPGPTRTVTLRPEPQPTIRVTVHETSCVAVDDDGQTLGPVECP